MSGTSPIATLRGESKNPGFTLFSVAWSVALEKIKRGEDPNV